MRRLSSHKILLVLLCMPGLAQAGIVFTPHLSEYSIQASAPFSEFTFITTEIESIYDKYGNEVELGTPFVPAGDSTDAVLVLYKYLWIGNVFRDTTVPVSYTHLTLPTKA